MDTDAWGRLAAVASKRHQTAYQSRHDPFLVFDDFDGAGGDEDLRAEFPCPFCAEDFDILGLCCHFDDEHPVEAKNGVLSSLIEKYMQQKRRSRKGSSGSRSTLSTMRKELREVSLQTFLEGFSYKSSPQVATPDPFFSSLIYTSPVANSSSDVQTECLDEGSLTDKCLDEKEIERPSSNNSSLSGLDHQERALRSAFAQGLILSTIFDDDDVS